MIRCILAFFTASAQPRQKIEILTLGTFHFNFPNLDIIKADSSDQIDVLNSRYQTEIEQIAADIARFRPTIIVIERDPAEQGHYDSLYRQCLQGTYALKREEEEQPEFWIARQLKLPTLYCVDSWGKDYEMLTPVLEGTDSVQHKQFMDYFYASVDSGIASAARDRLSPERIARIDF